MTMLNKSATKKIITEATARGELNNLVYYVDMQLPRDLRPTPDAANMPATDPPGQLPVVMLEPDPEAAYHYAHLLQALIESANKNRGIVFSIELTTLDILRDLGYVWYVWGEMPHEVDVLCPTCGAISRGLPGTVHCCAEELPAYAGTYSGQWWGGL